MDFSGSNQFDILEIYRRYCESTSGAFTCAEDGYREDDASQKSEMSREALSQLLKFVESRMHARIQIFDEVSKLMSRLNLMANSCEFSRFYNFVFFICRENGQKSITVARAVVAWRLVMSGRFRLLNQWCNFVEKKQRHNISEDTWRQVLAFSRCVNENLEGYDPEGAWPVLIDEFVEHMFGGSDTLNLSCNCKDSEAQLIEDSFPGLKILPGLKRKLSQNFEQEGYEDSNKLADFSNILISKRRHVNFADNFVSCGRDPSGNTMDDDMEIVKCSSSSSPSCCSKSSPCGVEGCLSKGFAGLFSGQSYLQFDHDRKVGYT